MGAIDAVDSDSSRRQARDRRLAAAAAALVCALSLTAIARVLGVIVSVEDDLQAQVIVAASIELAAVIVGVAGLAFVLMAFRPPSLDRPRRLRVGLLMSAVSAAGIAVAYVLYFNATIGLRYPGGYRLSLLSKAFGYTALLVGSLVAARAFSRQRSDLGGRDRALAWVAFWFAIWFALVVAYSLLYVLAYSRYAISGDFRTGLLIGAAGVALFATAAATAVAAFSVSSRRLGAGGRSAPAVRERLLACAAGIFAVGGVAEAVGAALVAAAYADTRAIDQAGVWLLFGTAVGYAVAAVLALSGFAFTARAEAAPPGAAAIDIPPPA